MNAEKLKEYRKRNSLTQGELAKVVKTSIRAVQSWEQGQRKVPQSAITLMELNEGITAGRDIITGGTNITGEVERNATINIDNSNSSKELSDAQEKNVALMEEKVKHLESKIKKGEVELNEVVTFTNGKPYYNIDFINVFNGVEEIVHHNPEYNIDYPPANHCEFWVNATGESMKGVIDNGDKIALKLVDKEWFPLGEVYAIITTNGHRMVKKIVKSEDKECYRLVSENPDKDKFPDQDIPKMMIQTLFKVVTAIKFIN